MGKTPSSNRDRPRGRRAQAGSAPYARRLIGFLSSRRRSLSPLLILTHDYPDPDALATAFALQFLAGQVYGITAKIVYGGVIGRAENRAMVQCLKISARKFQRSDLRRYRHIALVDTQPNFQNNRFPSQRRATLVIDQHGSIDTPLAELALVDPDCGATSVIVAQALLLLKLEIPVSVATALAYGILSDTLELYTARRPDIVRTYLDILPRCDMRALARIQRPLHAARFFATLGRALRQAQLHRSLVSSHLGSVPNPELVGQIADFLMTYRRARWSFCTGRYRGKLHASLRSSQPNAHASVVLRDVFGNPRDAGGHDTMAGGSVRVGRKPKENTWQRVEETLRQRLLKRLRIPAGAAGHTPFL